MEYQLGEFTIREHEQLDSTNSEASRLSFDEMKDKMVILTYCQTRGRGQIGNHWESAPLKNISMTVILKPEDLLATDQFAISIIAALGVRDLVARHVSGVSIKWPNDIYVGDRKIAGILIEHTIMGNRVGCSFCGIGLNVNQERFLSDAPNPVSLYQLLGRELSLPVVLEELLDCIASRYRQLNDLPALKAEYLRHLYRRSGTYRWQDTAGEEFQASIQGIDEYGRLLLSDTTGHTRVSGFKEVKYL